MKGILICHHSIFDVIKKGKYKLSLYQEAKANSTIRIGTDAISACQNSIFIGDWAFTFLSGFLELQLSNLEGKRAISLWK